MKLEKVGYKEEIDLNIIAYSRVKSSGIVSFRKITRILGCIFHLSRQQTFQLLGNWERKRWVKIYPYHGVEFVKKN